MKIYCDIEIEYIKEILNYLKLELPLDEKEIMVVEKDFNIYIHQLKSENLSHKEFIDIRSAFRIKQSNIIEKFVRHNFQRVGKLLGLDKTTYFYYDITKEGYLHFDIEEIRLQVGVALARHPDFDGSIIDKVTKDALDSIRKYIVHPEFKIREISFVENYLDNEEFNIIVETLKDNKTCIKYLDLSNNSITSDLFKQLKEKKPWIFIILDNG